MQRLVQPEILDSLPHDDKRALSNRRDLRLINALLRNPQWFSRKVFSQLQTSEHILEFGAGEGVLGLRLARQLGADAVRYTAVDFAPPPAGWPERFQWRRIDCLDIADFNDCDALIGNMILHQFQDDALKTLGDKIQRSRLRLLAFVEPARYRLHQWQLRALGPIVCDVSHHDGSVSVRAGFRNNELAELLGLGPEWSIQASNTLLGAYRMLAVREKPAV